MLSALLLFFFVSAASDSIFNVAAASNSDLKDAAASNQATDFIIEVGEMEKIRIGENGTIEIRLLLSENIQGSPDKQIEIRLELAENSTSTMKLLNNSIIYNSQDIGEAVLKKIHYEGIQLGLNHIKFLHEDLLIHTLEVPILANSSVLNDIFMLVMMSMIIVNTINMGAQLDLEVLKEVFKRPIGPAVGFFCQFLMMPLLSFLVGYLITDDKLFRLGLFVLGCCPGGTGSNFWTLLLGGDINLSITMTFVSTVAALGMMPFWIFTMSPYLTDGDIVVPFSQLIISLMSLILPVVLGMWIRWRWPKAGGLMEKVIVPFTLLTVLFILTGGVYVNLFIFELMTPLMVAAGFVVAFSGYFAGAGLSYLFRLPTAQITAVSVETAFQNGSIAFVLLKMSFPEPLGELASVAPVAQLLITGLPLWGLLALLKIYQRCCKKKKEEYVGVPLDRV